MRRTATRDERGSTLPLALVFMVILGTIGVAVLGQQASASHVQTAYTGVHARELAIDGAVDATIAGIRYDERAGVSNAVDPGATVCANTALPGSLMGPFSWSGEQYDIYCAAKADSGSAPWGRTVTISACVHDATPCQVGEVLVRANIDILDRWGQAIGAQAKVKSWVRNPTV